MMLLSKSVLVASTDRKGRDEKSGIISCAPAMCLTGDTQYSSVVSLDSLLWCERNLKQI